MKYRINRRTGDRISEIGLGSAYLCDADMDEAVRALRAAYDGGINYFDLGAGNGKAFSMWREALGDVRKNVLYQGHFGADYSKGEYGWTLELETVERSVDWMLKELGTDTIDYGMISVAGILGSLIPVAITLIFQKYIVMGMTAGGVKE